MITNFVFTVGLPGCGKSTYLKEHYNNVFDYRQFYGSSFFGRLGEYCNIVVQATLNSCIVISADEIKETLPSYDPNDPECVHESSVQIAKAAVYDLANSRNFKGTVVMDGGGLNNHYTQDIIEYVKEKCVDCKITCLFFDTPIDVCIERVNSRERKIPEHAFYEKNLKISECLARYQALSDEYIRVDYFTNKYIFLDMDGTIVSYRKGKIDQYGNTDFVNSQLFLRANPVPHIINYVKDNFDLNNVYIITAVANNIVLEEKLKWMQQYFPELPKENFLWVGNKDYKHVFLHHFSILKKMDPREMTIIDDLHSTLNKCSSIGMNAIHPSNIYALTDKYSTLG